MRSAADGRQLGQHCAAQTEDGRGIAVAEGFQCRKSFQIVQCEKARFYDLIIDLQSGFRSPLDLPEIVFPEPTCKSGDFIFGNGNACSHFVSAEIIQQIGTGFQRCIQGERPETAAGPSPHALFINADHDGRYLLLLCDTGSDDAHDTLKPAAPCQHERAILARRHGVGLFVDAADKIAAFLVQRSQFRGDTFRLLRIGRVQKAYRIFCPAHSAGRIQTRSQRKADRRGCHAFDVQTGIPKQRHETGAGCMFEEIQSAGYQNAVLPGKGDNIGDGAQSDQLQKAVGNRCESIPPGQSADCFEGDAHTGEVLVGIGTVRTFGVDHGDSIRNFRFALMVVGHDNIHSQGTGVADLLHGCDAAVHSDDQIDAVIMELPDSRDVQAVSVLGTPGDVIGDVKAQ